MGSQQPGCYRKAREGGIAELELRLIIELMLVYLSTKMLDMAGREICSG